MRQLDPSSFNLRFARESDLERILEIYAPFVEQTAISFEIDVPSFDDFRKRFWEISQKYPWLVFEIENQVVGYAYGSPHRPRSAYRWSADVSIYLDPNHHRKQVGRSLYLTLLLLLRAQGYFNAYAGITLPNEASVALHRSLGFQEVGVCRSVGFKLGQWHDVVWYQRELQRSSNPQPPLLSSELIEQLHLQRDSIVEGNRMDLLNLDLRNALVLNPPNLRSDHEPFNHL